MSFERLRPRLPLRVAKMYMPVANSVLAVMMAIRYTGVCRMRYSALEESASFPSRFVAGVAFSQVCCSLIP